MDDKPKLESQGPIPRNALKPWQFKKGQSASPSEEPEGDQRSPPIPRLLRDMRKVYEQDKSRDKGSQKALRKLLNEKPNTFLVQMAGLEKAHLAAQSNEPAPEPDPEPEERDMGTERATELLNKLLADFHAEEHKKNVELAARPDAAKIGATLQNALAGALEREQQLLRRIREHEHERYQVAKP